MKYMSEPDGEVFDSEQECFEHERAFGTLKDVHAQVDKYCSMLDYANDRARARAATQIMGWIAYDMKQRPERYKEEEVDEAAIASITGAA